MDSRQTARAALIGILLAQAGVLLARLDLLSIWGDEMFTLETARLPLEGIFAALKVDIHPPLYYLLAHYWLALPLPLGSLEKLRALSALWMVGATWILARTWLREWEWRKSAMVLAMFAFSPCAVLYARMARSYAMQTAVGLLAAWWMLRFRERGDGRSLAAATAGCLALLYTHYVPGIALVAAFSWVVLWEGVKGGAWRRIWMWMGALAVIGLGYLPWLLTLRTALEKWGAASGFSSQYLATGGRWTEHVLKLGFGGFSLLGGETGSVLTFVAAPVLLGGLVAGLCGEWKRERGLVVLLVMAALIGYVGVSRWVSYPFIPARLLWLLPFLVLLAVPRLPRWALVLCVAAHAVSIANYFTRVNFLNKGYAAPLREMAAAVRAKGPATVYADTFNTDSVAFAYYLGRFGPVHFVRDEKMPDGVASGPVWVVRNSHDISPGRISSRVEEALCRGRRREVAAYLAYSGWEKGAMRLIGIADPPDHFLLLTRCE